ncbi:MAG: PIG-L family deacetylase [Candidatus Peribacteraceae bacterium]|nr:PIG-L family deacetylase [Candidatus Peribacteraceae bacterium]
MKKILIIAPHPDDETFWMGGTIMKLKQRGYFIHLLILTLGEKSRHPKYNEEEMKIVRKKEAVLAANALRIDSYEFGYLEDTRIGTDEAYELIINAIRKERPQRIYSPCNPDTHQDHLSTYKATKLAAMHENVEEVFIYDSSRLHASMNFYEDISDLLDEKIKVCKLYGSQIMKDNLNVEAIKQKAIARGTEIGTGAAEAFKIVKFGDS